jgi:hypothetical protein
MAERDEYKKLQAIVRDILENCPGENAGQFIADRISLAWSLGYEQCVEDHKDH